MILRRSEFVHVLDLGGTSALAIHAVTQMRVTVTPEVGRLIGYFAEPHELDTALPRLTRIFGFDGATLRAAVMMLLERGILTDQTVRAERESTRQALTGSHMGDPIAQLDHHRRASMEGPVPYWAVQAPQAIDEARTMRRRLDVLMLGDCDVQMETDFLRREAARRGVDLRAAASFSADIGLAAERRHDVVIIGALQARHGIVLGDPVHHSGDPARVYVAAVQTMLDKLRAITAAPILIDGLPEPTVQPLGFADRGPHSHRNRFRQTNFALAKVAEDYTDVHLVDVAAALGAVGSASLLDDGLVHFTHFGSPGWMLRRPASELSAVHSQFPDMQGLESQVGSDPYRREAVMAKVHMDVITTVLGIDRKRCVIVDLDGVLWPGVLAETGRPFAWSPEIGGPNSYVGLYFGIHEALRALRRRGILLACVSKNDADTVRNLWHYEQHYPRHLLLTPDKFVCSRINWDDKATNIRSIADELGFALDTFVFVDDSPRERERVRQSLPEVAVLGDDLFTLRHRLLTDPRLQPARLTQEAGMRSELVSAQLDRARLRAEIPDEAAFIASLAVVCTVDRLTPDTTDTAVLERVRELIARTTQFNATGRTFTTAELEHLIGAPDSAVFTLRMSDRLSDHGLVGAAVVVGCEILNFVLSCRVIGLGGERALLAKIIARPMTAGQKLAGQIVATNRNLPVRHLYADHGFTEAGGGRWTLARPIRKTSVAAKRPARSAIPPQEGPLPGAAEIIPDGVGPRATQRRRHVEANTILNEGLL